ncbi:MAG: 30S ribosomal protein S4e [Nanoarchaeota archaeon]|nr:30S ribosomal protein S4e [Nanoarchaeota archaeon]
MTKNHLKRLTIPKTWPVHKKTTVYITRPNPGAHSFSLGMPLNVIMREVLGVTKTRKEVKLILHEQELLVDGKRIKDSNYAVGLMDILSIPNGKTYRCILDTRGKLAFIEIDKKEQSLKMTKIIGKRKFKGNKFQITLGDGRNMLMEKAPYAVGDTLLYTLPKGDIKGHFVLQKGASIMLVGGKNSGTLGTIEDIAKDKVIFKDNASKTIETLKKYVLVVGSDKPAYNLTVKDNE